MKSLRRGTDAVFDGRRAYRYLLWDIWDPTKPLAAFVMTNPSYADGKRTDPTWTRCRFDFAKEWGCGGALAANVCALISPDPAVLFTSRDPVGPSNEEFLREALEAEFVVAAWGQDGATWAGPFLELATRARRQLFCLGKTKRYGHPIHPLARGRHRVPKGRQPEVWTP